MYFLFSLTGRETEADNSVPSAGFLPRCLQQPELVQATQISFLSVGMETSWGYLFLPPGDHSSTNWVAARPKVKLRHSKWNAGISSRVLVAVLTYPFMLLV